MFAPGPMLRVPEPMFVEFGGGVAPGFGPRAQGPGPGPWARVPGPQALGSGPGPWAWAPGPGTGQLYSEPWVSCRALPATAVTGGAAPGRMPWAQAPGPGSRFGMVSSTFGTCLTAFCA